MHGNHTISDIFFDIVKKLHIQVVKPCINIQGYFVYDASLLKKNLESLNSYNSLMGTFSRIYNLLDHPSKDNYKSKYSRYNLFVTGTACNSGSVDDGDHSDKEAKTGQSLMVRTECMLKEQCYSHCTVPL